MVTSSLEENTPNYVKEYTDTVLLAESTDDPSFISAYLEQKHEEALFYDHCRNCLIKDLEENYPKFVASLKSSYKGFIETVTEDRFEYLLKLSTRPTSKDKYELAEIPSIGYSYLKFAPENIRDKEEIVMEAVRNNPGAVVYASERLKDNEDIIKTAVEKDPWKLIYASDRLKNNKEIVMIAVKQHGDMVKYASNELKADKEVLLEAYRRGQNTFFFYGPDELRGDRDFMISLIKTGGGMRLMHGSDEIRDDKDIVKLALQDGSHELVSASERLQDDEEVVRLAVKENPYNIMCASERLKNNEDIVMLIVADNSCPDAFGHVSDELRGNKEFIKKAVRKNPKIFRYVSDELKQDPEIKEIYFQAKYGEETEMDIDV